MNKKLISMVLSIGIMASTITGINTVCAEDNISVELNGQKLQFSVPPQIINDYTMVPMRGIFEALGYEVTWSAETQMIKASRGQQMIILTINSTQYSDCNLNELANSKDVMATFQNTSHELNTPPVIVEGSTLVPVRAISEIAGCTVNWDASTKTVSITGKTYSKIDILNDYLFNNCTVNDGEYIATYNYDEYTEIIAYDIAKNTTTLTLIEPFDEPIMGHWFTHWTTIYLDSQPMYCTYDEVGGTHIEATIPTNFKTSLYNGINRTYPTGNIISGAESYYEKADRMLAYRCTMAFLIFNMYTSKNNINLQAADFGVVLDK